MRTGRTYYNFIAAVVLIAATILAIYSGVGVSYAATTSYSDVLDDLQQDSTFNVADYPATSNDYSLNVIQIAESVDGELFLYVYQPAAKAKLLKATAINMSLSDSADGTTLFNLTMLNNAGVFQKYRVEGVTVSSDLIRYYVITSIYRAWDKDIDQEADNDNTITEIALEVAQKWTVTTLKGEIFYDMTETEVITVTRKRCGFIRYPNGLNFNTSIGACDGHFVVFSCDRDIDKLLAARVSFMEQTYKNTASGTNEGTPKPNETYIVHDNYATNTPAIFGSSIQWQRIQTGAEFAKNATGLKEEDKLDIATYQWVLNFYETPYEAAGGSLAWAGLDVLNPLFLIPAFINLNNATGTWVTDVSILELTFEKDGKVYNMGVVDNKQSGPRDPLNTPEDGLPLWFYVAIGIGALVLVCIAFFLISIFFPPVGKALYVILKGVGTALWWIISAPFRFVALIVRKIGERKAAAPAKAAPSNSCKTKAKSTKPRARTRNTGKAKPRNVKPRAGSKRK